MFGRATIRLGIGPHSSVEFHFLGDCFCETVCPMPSDCCLSVLSVCIVFNVGVGYCGQTVRRIKMKLGMQVGLSPGHILLDGDPVLLPKGAQPQF